MTLRNIVINADSVTTSAGPSSTNAPDALIIVKGTTAEIKASSPPADAMGLPSDGSSVLRFSLSSGWSSGSPVTDAFALGSDVEASPASSGIAQVSGIGSLEYAFGKWSTPRYSTNSFSYTGDGTGTRTILLPFEADLVAIKGRGANAAIFWGRHTGFCGRPSSVAAVTDSTTTFVDGLILTTQENANGTVYSVLCIQDPFETVYAPRVYRGAIAAGRVLTMLKGRSIAGALMKRDSSTPMYFLDQVGCVKIDNTAISTAKFAADGSLTSTSDADMINGETTSIHAFQFSENVDVVRYAGGAQSRIVSKFDAVEAALFVPLEANSIPAAIWISSDAGNLLPLTAAAALAGEAAISGGVATIATTSNYNLAGRNYVAIFFRRKREIKDEGFVRTKPKTLVLGPSTYLDCGTSDTLKFSGAQSQEFYGFVALAGKQTGTGNQDPNSRAVIVRANEAANYGDAVVTSFGLWAAHVYYTNERASWWHSVNTTLNFPTAGATDPSKVFQSGENVREGRLQHIVVTISAAGEYKLYVDGVLARQTCVATAAYIRTGGTGHRTIIGGQKINGAIDMANNHLGLCELRTYPRELTAAEIAANHRSCLNCGATPVVSGFTEEWLARNYSGGVLPATVNSANNGTLVGTSVTMQ